MPAPPRLRLAQAALCLGLVFTLPFAARAAARAFVQKAVAESDSGTSLDAVFKRANADGSLLVAYVAWDGAGAVSLSDTQGNTWENAVGPTAGPVGSAQVLFARNAKPGKNVVTASFDGPVARHAALFVHEYTGMSHGAPFDVSVAASGSDPNVAVGGLDTNTSGDVLFLAVTSDGRSLKRLTHGYKTRARAGGTLTADRFAGDAHADYAAAAEQSGSGWIAQLVSFHYAGVPPKGAPKYPLKAGPGSPARYLVDQNGQPFLMTGDSPQSMFANISESDAARYLADRQKRGFNVLWINLLCNDGISNPQGGCRSDATTFDGIPELLGGLTQPNEAYFARVDRMIRMAATRGITVLLDPAETRGWLGVLEDAGAEGAGDWGNWVGRRYRGFDNIIWMSGNDFNMDHLPSAGQDAVVQAVAQGIQDVDSSHIHTVELFFKISGSLDDSSWAPLIQLNASYTYAPTYAQVLEDYNRGNALPTFLVEANYEFENEAQGADTNQVLRRQAYWALLAGATGHMYGNGYTWPFLDGWQSHYKTKAADQMTFAKKLFEARAWWQLVPDQDHSTVTDGFGGFESGDVGVMNNDYVTAARTPDGKLVMAYDPAGNTLTVDLGRLSGPVRASWFDPSRGSFSKVSGSPFDPTGPMQLAPPGMNREGAPDWVLVLEAE
ncbi:MAG TPA: DUF4038 domain-containing protein [Myxococcota bacterium]|nr:DUF4038 domain-containing protein [Myxococcota bacterium]